MKKTLLIVIVALVLGGWALFPKGSAADMCYIWNTEAGDSATLHIKLVDDQDVTGSFNYRPFQKDSKTGAITGTLSPVVTGTPRLATLRWNAEGEGVQAKEELFIKIENGIAQPGFGEMVEQDGIRKYAHPEAIVYALNLQQANCE